jgi:hypothetical protein
MPYWYMAIFEEQMIDISINVQMDPQKESDVYAGTEATYVT